MKWFLYDSGPRATRFCPGNFAPKHLHYPSKSVMLLEPVAVNVIVAPASLCQRVNVVR